MFPPHWREASLAMLDDTVDVVVVGGGITGCGILLDAAQRGLRAVLVERDDIASGTSSRSSKLVHGGVRYLKQMQFRITRLACRERDRMLALNPHLVHPIRFLYPTFRGDRTPGWQVDLGLWMYDRLTARPEKHSQLDLAEVTELAPGLATEDLDRALAYTDAMADDARLTLAVAATAHAYGAGVLTRCEALEAARDAAGRAVGLVVRNLETDTTHRIVDRHPDSGADGKCHQGFHRVAADLHFRKINCGHRRYRICISLIFIHDFILIAPLFHPTRTSRL